MTAWPYLHLVDQSTTASIPLHFIRLTAEARSDIEWWYQFIKQWNGMAMLHPLSGPTSKLTTDASGYWGCRAFSDEKWFQLSWPNSIVGCHISVKELTPVVLATAILGGTQSTNLLRQLNSHCCNQQSNVKSKRISPPAMLLVISVGPPSV